MRKNGDASASLSTLGLVALLACAARQPSAASPYADPERDCQSTQTLLAPGRGPTPQMAPALWRVRACPARAGELLAHALESTRLVSDSGQLEAATWLTQYVHDARILSSGIAVAADTAATPEARVAALRVLLWAKAPGHLVSLQAMSSGPQCIPPMCRSSYTGHFYNGGPTMVDTVVWPVVGIPMPPGYTSRIDSVAREIASSPSTPGLVRAAARVVIDFPPDRELKDW
jgi:hypothetical protein